MISRFARFLLIPHDGEKKPSTTNNSLARSTPFPATSTFITPHSVQGLPSSHVVLRPVTIVDCPGEMKNGARGHRLQRRLLCWVNGQVAIDIYKRPADVRRWRPKKNSGSTRGKMSFASPRSTALARADMHDFWMRTTSH
jgi:hypothetical protein